MNIIAVLAAFVCGLPILAVAAIALGGGSTDYLRHLAETRLPTYLFHSAYVGLVASLTAAVIGTGLAWLTARCEFPGRKFFTWALILPLAVPAYVAAYAWLDLSQAGAPLDRMTLGLFPTVRGSWGSGLMFALVLYPYVYLLARNAFVGQSADAYDAARTLGASPLRAFWRTSLPMARPAIAAGMALVVMEALADYGTVAHLGSPTLSIGLIRAWSGAGSLLDAARLSLILVAFALIVFGLERHGRKRMRVQATSGKQRPARRFELSAPQAMLACLAAFLALFLSMILPLGRLAWRALREPMASGLAEASLNSLTVAGTAAVIATLVGLTTAYALRRKSILGTAAARLAGVGYAVPGAVAAVGVIALLSGIQRWLDPTWESLTGNVFPILLTGTAGALVLAYLSRFVAAAISPCETALTRVTQALDGAARTLGASTRRRLLAVHLPLIAPGVASALILSFVEILKELPATMILRPFNFDTLAIMAHQFASDERLGEAAAPALLIPLIATLPMIFVARYLSATGENGANR